MAKIGDAQLDRPGVNICGPLSNSQIVNMGKNIAAPTRSVHKERTHSLTSSTRTLLVNFGFGRWWQNDGSWCRVAGSSPPSPLDRLPDGFLLAARDLSSSAQTHHQRQKYLNKQLMVTIIWSIDINIWADHKCLYKHNITFTDPAAQMLYILIHVVKFAQQSRVILLSRFQIWPNCVTLVSNLIM